MSTNPYDIWSTRKSLGVIRQVKPEYQYWLPMFNQAFHSDSEWIDFSKIPVGNRKMAAFALPLAKGKPVWEATERTFRVKPAYAIAEDYIDPLKGMSTIAGIDTPFLDGNRISIEQRREVLRTQISISHVQAINRRWEWLAAKAIIDGKVTLTGKDYPTTLVDFGRAAGNTQTLTSGNRYGDSGVSIVDHIQSVADTMANAEFGGTLAKVTMGSAVWAVMRKDAEFLKHLDLNTAGGNIVIERGLVSSDRIFKVGEMFVGGASGARIELWVNNDYYYDDTTATNVRFVAVNEIVFTASADAIGGFRCFGVIVDPDANYQPYEIFPKTFFTGDRVKTENIAHTSSPLMVPVNPDATFKATVLA